MSGNVTMQDMAAMRKQLMDQMNTVAKRDDLQVIQKDVTEIKTTVDKVSSRVDTVEGTIEKLQKEMAEMQVAVRKPRTSTGSSASTSTTTEREPTTAHSDRGPWCPRVVHVRGRAPFGAGDSAKLPRASVVSLQEQITRLLPDDGPQMCKWMNPFIRSHMISFGVMAATYGAAKKQADIVSIAIHKHNKVTGKEIKAAVETSPERRAVVKEFYHQRDTVIAINDAASITASNFWTA